MTAVLLVAFGAVLVLGGLVALVVVARRARPEPHAWEPRPHAAAVQRALRAGRADDPRIDALTRAEAARTLRRRWLLWFLPALALLFGAGLVGDLRDPDTTGWDLAFQSVWTAGPVLALAHQVQQMRRSRRYLAAPEG